MTTFLNLCQKDLIDSNEMNNLETVENGQGLTGIRRKFRNYQNLDSGYFQRKERLMANHRELTKKSDQLQLKNLARIFGSPNAKSTPKPRKTRKMQKI